MRLVISNTTSVVSENDKQAAKYPTYKSEIDKNNRRGTYTLVTEFLVRDALNRLECGPIHRIAYQLQLDVRG